VDGVEAVLAILERFRTMRQGGAAPSPVPAAPAAPRPIAAPPRAQPADPLVRPSEPAYVAPSDSLLPFRGGAKSIARAIVAAEVLAPPVSLRSGGPGLGLANESAPDDQPRL
jgi:hypothetical protein